MNTSNSIIKGNLQTVVLQLILNNGDLYGYQIIQLAEKASGGKITITEAALYPVLHQLEANGYVKVKEVTVGGRQRKYYKLSNTGKKLALQQHDTLLENMNILKKVLKYKG